MGQIQTNPSPATNSGFALWGLTCFVETFVQSSAFVLRMNSSAKNPPQRKVAKRCATLCGQRSAFGSEKITKKNEDECNKQENNTRN